MLFCFPRNSFLKIEIWGGYECNRCGFGTTISEVKFCEMLVLAKDTIFFGTFSF